MKILNLYAGIGGNRKLWGEEHDITAVELNASIASIYHDLWPSDKVVIADAHQYLLEHYSKYDFIWSSPPCPSHSRMNYLHNVMDGRKPPSYPDMSLYQQIIFLDTWYNGKYVIENVIPYYKPLIPAQSSGRHLFWANFKLPHLKEKTKVRNDKGHSLAWKQKQRNIKIDNWHGIKIDKRKVLNNCVEPSIGKAILDAALNIYNSKTEQLDLFR